MYVYLFQSLIDSFMPLSPSRQTLNESNSGLPIIQQPIMSMEDDDMSDQEVVCISNLLFFYQSTIKIIILNEFI